MLSLNNLKGAEGSNRNTKRIGRGQGSGQGTQAGKGHKGQKARKSGHVRTGFEGNNLPLYMRLPKRGFSNSIGRKFIVSVTTTVINSKFKSGDLVSPQTLSEKGVLKGINTSATIKIIGGEVLSTGIRFENVLYTKSVLSSLDGNVSK